MKYLDISLLKKKYIYIFNEKILDMEPLVAYDHKMQFPSNIFPFTCLF